MKEKEGSQMFDYTTIETDRTVLKVLGLEQIQAVYQHFLDPAVTMFMDIEPCKDLKEAEEIIQYHLDDSGSRWGIYSKDNDQFLGTCGFHYLRKKDEGIVAEIGFDLAKTHWGKGVMTEVLEALIDFGFTRMNLKMIDATVEPANFRSLKLLRKLGFRQHDELQDHLVYFSLVWKDIKKIHSSRV
jgi:[ribosomal protein S5]-alanine N-acetyltransferase